METPYQVLEPYLWDDPEGGQNVCDGDAITAMKEYAEMYHEFHLRQIKNLKTPTIKKRCFCGTEWDGVECQSCGFDASEVDIY